MAEGLAGQADASAHTLLRNPRISFLNRQEEHDLRGAPRLIALLSLIAQRQGIALFALHSDHKPGTNYEAGRAADIAEVDGETRDPEPHATLATSQRSDGGSWVGLEER